MIIEIGDDKQVVMKAETKKEAYKIGRLSKIIGNTTTIQGDDIKIQFNYEEILDMQRRIEEQV